jgi:hypothetical protein
MKGVVLVELILVANIRLYLAFEPGFYPRFISKRFTPRAAVVTHAP